MKRKNNLLQRIQKNAFCHRASHPPFALRACAAALPTAFACALPLLALPLVLYTPTAFASNECGAANGSTPLTCTSSGNNYTNGITYSGADINITLQNGSIVNTSTGNPSTSGNYTVGFAAPNNGVLNAGNARITVEAGASVTTTKANLYGIFARGTAGGTVTINNSGDISATGTNGRGIYTYVANTTTINNTTTGRVTGALYGIHAESATNNKNINVTNDGTIVSTEGQGVFLRTSGASGALNFTQSSTGSISGATNGLALTSGGSSVTVNNAGTITAGTATSSNGLHGIIFTNVNGSLINSGTIRAIASSGVLTKGVQVASGSINITNTATGLIEGNAGLAFLSNNNTLLNQGTITGTGSVAIRMSGNNNRITLNTGSVINGRIVSTGTGNTLVLQGTGTIGPSAVGVGNIENIASLIKQGNQEWTINANVSTTSTAANAVNIQAGTLTMDGNLVNAGGTTIAAGANLQIGTGATSGTITGNVINNGNIFFNRSDNSSYSGVLSGSGNLTKQQSGTLTLSGVGSVQNNVTVSGGTLAFTQNGAFQALGNYSTQSGAATTLAGGNSTLNVGGTFTQAAGSTLNVALNHLNQNTPLITAGSIDISGSTLKVDGFQQGLIPVKASEAAVNHILMQATNGPITGNFTNTDLGPNYLVGAEHLINGGNTLALGFDLAWTANNATYSTGNFTLASGTAFDVDVALDDVAAINGWSGNSLTKDGAGLLVLSKSNAYTGTTTVSAGVLQFTGVGAINNSSQVLLNTSSANLDISTSNNGVTLNNLDTVAGSQIYLGNKQLTVNSTQDTSIRGSISGSGGLTKIGTNTLTLTGHTDWTGATYINAGTLTLDGTLPGSAQLVSDIYGQAGTTLNLLNGAHLQGRVDPVALNIDAASGWTATGTSSVTQMSLAGSIKFNSPNLATPPGRSLTAQSWIGQNGTLTLYTTLEDSNSYTDKLIIDGGTVTGNTQIKIINFSGWGDLTTGNGITIIHAQNGATTANGNFSLAAPVRAGIYEYLLYHGGSGAPQDWFLRSTSPTNLPNYRPEASLYSTQINQLTRYNSAIIASLNERMGDFDALAQNSERKAWGQVIGRHDSKDGARLGLYNQDIGARSDFSALQVGNDFHLTVDADKRQSAGVFFTAGHSVSDVTHVNSAGLGVNAGSNKVTAYSLAGYFTQINNNGTYLDALTQASYFDIRSETAGSSSADNNGTGLAASFEFGKRFTLGEPAANGRPTHSIEPQAQLILQSIKISDSSISDSFGQSRAVRFDRSNRATLRLGTRFVSTWNNKLSAWIRPDLLHTYGRESQTHFAKPTQGEVSFSDQRPGTSLALQVGLEGFVSNNVSTSLRVGGERTVSGNTASTYFGQIGVKMSF